MKYQSVLRKKGVKMNEQVNQNLVNELTLFYTNYINKLKHEEKSINTINSYKNTIKSFIEYICEINDKIKLSSLKPLHIYSFLDYCSDNMEKQGELKISTKRVMITHLKAFFSFMEQNSDELLDFTKLFKDFKFKTIRSKPKGLESNDEQKLLNLIEKEKSKRNDFQAMRNALIIKTMLFTGIRVSEMLSIKYEDYKESEPLFEISVIGKGRKQRFVYLAQELIEDELDELMLIRSKSSLVCLSSNDKPIPRQNIDKMIKSICMRAGISKIGAHTLRHTFANNYTKKNGNVIHLQDILGHSNVQTTMIYANPRKEDVRNGFLLAMSIKNEKKKREA